MRRTIIALALIGMLAMSAEGCGEGRGSRLPAPPRPPRLRPPLERPMPGPPRRRHDPAAAAFPVTITHKFGEITIDAPPERVVSIGFADQDWLLALGVTPIAECRDWYGDQPYATWPWAQDELGDAQPAVLTSTELNFEEIAALRPDLIVGVVGRVTDAR